MPELEYNQATAEALAQACGVRVQDGRHGLHLIHPNWRDGVIVSGYPEACTVLYGVCKGLQIKVGRV